MPIKTHPIGRCPIDSVDYIDFLGTHAPEFDDALYQVLRPQVGNVDTIKGHRTSCATSAGRSNEFRTKTNAVICDRLAALVEHVLGNPDENSRDDLLEVIETEQLFDHPERLEAAKAGLRIPRNTGARRLNEQPVIVADFAPLELPMPRAGVYPEGADIDLLNWLKTAPTGAGESGLYCVQLVGIPADKKVSVNAQDPRFAHRCLHVGDAHTKVGKANSFRVREANYDKTFCGRARFHPVLVLPKHAVHAAEKLMKQAFDPYRQRNPFTGRKTEWLGGLTPHATLVYMLRAIRESALLAKIPGAKLTPTLAASLDTLRR